MNLKIAPNYEALSQMAAKDLIQLAASIKSPLICTASGDSPAGLYRELAKEITHQQLDFSNWQFLGLDEWAGMNGTVEGSSRFHLDRQLYGPLAITKEQICFFDGKAPDLREECNRVERFISEKGGIDIAILGLGLNGHIAMNEPGTDPSIRSHVASIDPLTQQTGQKYFTSPQDLSQGLTLGLATLLEAKHILLLVSGAHKAAILKKVLEEPPTTNNPATLFRNHPHITMYVDKEAAQLVQLSNHSMG